MQVVINSGIRKGSVIVKDRIIIATAAFVKENIILNIHYIIVTPGKTS